MSAWGYRHGLFGLAIIIFLMMACRSPQSWRASSNTTETLAIDSLERTCTETNPPLPLLIAYGTGRNMQPGLGFDAYADERGFYMAYLDPTRPKL
jgi:hypothetical protein